MAIPYPYNRLGINAGGTVTPLEPIEGSQGVFWYASNTNNLISSAMQMVNKTMYSNNRINVWSKGYLLNPAMGWRSESVYVYSGGTVLNVSVFSDGRSNYIGVDSGGYLSKLIFNANEQDGPYRCSVCCYNGYLENVTLAGSDNYLLVENGGMVNSVQFSGGHSQAIGARPNVTIFNITVDEANYSYNPGTNMGDRQAYIDISGNNIIVSNVSALPGSFYSYGYGIYFSVNIYGSVCTNVDLLDFKLDKYGLYNIDGFGTSVKLTGSNESGSLWLSNNTLHNIILREDYNYIQVRGSDSVFIDTLFIPGSSAGLFVRDSSAYYSGNNITKRLDGCLQYPYKWDSFSINGFADEGGRFGYSNGTGSNIVFGGYSNSSPVVTLYGEIIDPYIKRTFTLYSGTLISPHIYNDVVLSNNATILNYQGESSDNGNIYLFGYKTSITSTVPDGSLVIETCTNPPLISNANINEGAFAIRIRNGVGIATNITQGTAGIISVNTIYQDYSYVYDYGGEHTTCCFYDERIINGTNPYGSFWYSKGTFYNPYVIGHYNSYSGTGPLIVNTGASVVGGNVGPYYSGTVYLKNGGYISGLAIHTSGWLSIEEAAYQTAPSAIALTQYSGGNILPGYVWKYYGGYTNSATRNGAPPVIYGVNEFGDFSQESGILYNWAFYKSGIYHTFGNNVVNVHGATSLHLNGDGENATMVFSCYALSDYNEYAHSDVVDIQLDHIHLSKWACLELNHRPSEFRINAGTIYIHDIGSIRLWGDYSTTVSQYPYTGVTVNCVNYLDNQNAYLNILRNFNDKDFINTVNINSNANLNIFSGNYGTINVNSGGLLVYSHGNNYAFSASYINVEDGGFLFICPPERQNLLNITGKTERGNFIVSGTYVSNLLFNVPPNRFSLFDYQSGDAEIGPAYTVNDIYVSNDNRVYIFGYAVALSAYGGNIYINSNNKLNAYLYASDGYLYFHSCNSVSYVYLTDASARCDYSVTLNYITVNNGASIFTYSRNSVIYGDVNSGGVFYLGYSYPYISNGYTRYSYGRYNYASAINIQSGGTFYVGSSCSADDLRVNLGGTLVVGSRGTALNVISNGGANIISMNSASITYAS